MRYFGAAFLVLWLSGWTAGAGSVVLKVISGRFQAVDVIALAFMAFFAAFAVHGIYRALRPSVPESLRLLSDGVTYDSGIPPLQTGDHRSRNLDWKSMFPKRTHVELDWQKLQSLQLRETNDGNRLTVDVDGTRVDIARSASEIEREWLYQLLAERYSLASGKRNTPADRRSG